MMIYAIAAKNRIGIQAITFIELLVVIIILGILTGVSIPQFKKTIDNFEFENFIKDIYYLSCYLQNSAISQGKMFYLNIDQDQGKFWATYKVDEGFAPLKERWGKTYTAPKGVTFSFADIPGKIGQTTTAGIYFYPDGSVSERTIIFESRAKQKVSLIIKGAAGGIKIRQET